MPRRNLIGRAISRLRSERNWSQNDLAIQLQLEGVDISRDGVARVELGIAKVNDVLIFGLQRVFRLQIIRLFPIDIQVKDEQFAKREQLRFTKKPVRRRRLS